ncbi:MAG: glycosyltransferase family 2 protein [Phycisphaerae bacterium]|nr:glycosyltransferase family 2 protein [Phycisphaerae bacterium]
MSALGRYVGAAGEWSVPHRPSAVEAPASLAASADAETWPECCLKVIIVGAAAALLGVVLTSGTFWDRHTLFPQSALGRVFWIVMLAYGAMMYAALVWRISLWRRYRPMPPVEDVRLPSVSVIIPAFNEGSLVRQAILSVAGSRYPADRMEIIAVDDGSADDTWLHILAAAGQVQDRVRIVTLRQPANMGKRRALYRGFDRGRGDVFVTVDSDSVLAPDALRNAVTPLVRDPAVGCVAGCVQVLNPRQSLMTRFLKCTFSLSFKFVRAYQNEFRGVFCTPGALSVYRADVVRKVADEWLGQRFLGRPCVTGEDRAMTNLFLREGWLTAYQGNAVVRCKMPHTYGGLTRMFLRWARSNIRETMVLFGFMFSRFRTRYLHAFRLNMMLAALSLVVPALLIVNSTALLATNQGYLLRHLGVVILYAMTVSVIYYENERDSDWVWLFVYGFFWVACLSWIIPYAALTLRDTGWLTRQSARRAAVGQARPSFLAHFSRTALRVRAVASRVHLLC